MTSQMIQKRAMTHRVEPPRRVVLISVVRRDAVQRLSLAFTLLVRATDDCREPLGAAVAHQGDALTPARPTAPYTEET